MQMQMFLGSPVFECPLMLTINMFIPSKKLVDIHYTLELYRYHSLPIIPIPRITDYWRSRYRLCGRLWADIL